jgi:hypothetical protein
MSKLDPQRREIAIQVLMDTKMLKNYVEGVLRFMQVDKDSPTYRATKLRIAREQASKIIDDR